jgi:hypothetical protein
MATLRLDGLTLDEIGDHFGITRERVRQILIKHGHPTREELEVAASARRRLQALRLRRRVRRIFDDHATLPIDTLAELVGATASEVRRVLPAALRSRVSHKTGEVTFRWSDEAIFQALQAAATFSYPLTTTAYADLVRVGEVQGPSVPLISSRLGTWKGACAKAGIEAGGTGGGYESRWSDEDLIASVASYLRRPGSTGTAVGYDEWRSEDLPSFQTLRSRLGPWNEIKTAALESNMANALIGLGDEAHRLDAQLAAELDLDTRRPIWASAQSILDIGPMSETGFPGATALALGYVQSGKTTSIMALIASAVDEGYDVVVALLGGTNLLLDQNRQRVEESLGIGTRQDYVWAREVNPSGSRGASALATHLGRGRKLFIPVLKHAQRIRALADALAAVGDRAVLIIDDEADQASLNTSKTESLSKTFEAISALRLAAPNHLYVQYTATPYAPLLLNSEDLLHPDHVEFLQPGRGYTGGKEFFIDHAATVVRDVPALEEQASKTAPTELPGSLRVALASFIAGTAALFQGGLANAPVSMLVHSTARNDVQARYHFLISRQLRKWRAEVVEGRIPVLMADELARLRAHGVDTSGVDALSIAGVLREAHLWLVNSTAAVNSVEWTVSPVHILVGGNKLDRGFTVEGLTVTYMNRPATVQVDTLEQRARAFGYRGDLLPFCQFFASHRTIRGLREIVYTELDLRARLQDHIESDGSVASWAREIGLLMPEGMKPSRVAVLEALEHVPFGWTAQRSPSFSESDIESNWAAIARLGLPDADKQSYGRLEHRTVWVTGAKATELVENWQGAPESTGWNRAHVAEAMGRVRDGAVPVLLLEEASGLPRQRKWDASIGFVNIFQGRDAAYRPGSNDTYPGDRNVPAWEVEQGLPVIQIHRVSRRGHDEDVPVIAVYLGNRHITRKASFDD